MKLKRYQPAVEALEDRTLLSLDFGLAFGLSGPSAAEGEAITSDAGGNSYNVHVAGTFWSGTGNDFDPGTGKLSLPNAGNNDIFVVKLDANRKLLWARSIGGSGSGEFASGLAVDGAGNVFTTGAFTVTADFDPGSKSFNLTSAGNADVFVSQLSSAGNFVWAGRMGGPNGDVAYDLALGGIGNVYTTDH